MDENINAAPESGNATGSGQADMKKEVLSFVGKVEAWLDEYMVTKAPFQIPMAGKEFLAKIAPYLIIIFSILALPAILALFGITAFLAPVAMVAGGGMGWGFLGIVSVIASVIALVLDVMAIPGLFKRSAASWRLLFYASLVSFVGGVLSLTGVVGAVIGAIIGWYILFQVKELYKN